MPWESQRCVKRLLRSPKAPEMEGCCHRWGRQRPPRCQLHCPRKSRCPPPCPLECSEKYKSFKLKIPQPDSERRHSPDFRTVFGIMIGPFSFCEIGKTWGTNKQVNKQTNKNWKFQFPQPDYRPRHSPDFRTVFGIMIGPFSSCEIGKTWGLRTWEKALYKMRKSEKTTFQ